MDRVSKNTHISKTELEKLIKDNTENKLLGIFGEEKGKCVKIEFIYNERN